MENNIVRVHTYRWFEEDSDYNTVIITVCNITDGRAMQYTQKRLKSPNRSGLLEQRDADAFDLIPTSNLGEFVHAYNQTLDGFNEEYEAACEHIDHESHETRTDVITCIGVKDSAPEPAATESNIRYRATVGFNASINSDYSDGELTSFDFNDCGNASKVFDKICSLVEERGFECIDKIDAVETKLPSMSYYTDARYYCSREKGRRVKVTLRQYVYPDTDTDVVFDVFAEAIAKVFVD